MRRAGHGAVFGGAGRDGEARDRGSAHPCERPRAELAGRLRPLSYALDGDGTDAVPARPLQVHHRGRREGALTPLYSTQLCEFLCIPDGGEHLGN